MSRMAHRQLAERYRAGDREAVWNELRQLGARVRTPDLVEDAEAVCDEMAKRARQNIELIIERLREPGYVFHTNDDAQTPVAPHTPPGGRVEEVLGWLTENFPSVPMTLVSWLRHVGDVWASLQVLRLWAQSRPPLLCGVDRPSDDGVCAPGGVGIAPFCSA